MDTVESRAAWMAAAHRTLLVEAQAIESAAARLDGQLEQAVSVILAHPGKIVISGIGKSGHIGQKIAATLCSTGMPAVFLHAAEAVHGDLGVYTPGDPTILISKSGSTHELIRLLPILRQFNSPLIAIVGNTNSPLARMVDVVLDAQVGREADPLGIVPTASTIVALALGDALAAALMQARKFTEGDFARFHPAGQLGRNLYLRVRDVMHTFDAVAKVELRSSLRDLVIAMTERPLGAAFVLGGRRILAGLITDGDIRRALRSVRDLDTLEAHTLMTKTPVTISPDASLKEAVELMEDRPSQLSVLPVLQDDCCLGLIRIHDIYQPSLV